jgi:hypothetical protein
LTLRCAPVSENGDAMFSDPPDFRATIDAPPSGPLRDGPLLDARRATPCCGFRWMAAKLS